MSKGRGEGRRGDVDSVSEAEESEGMLDRQTT
jgi:hypothetical protein